MFKISTLIMKNSFHNILKYRDDLIYTLQNIDCRVKVVKFDDGLYRFTVSVLNFKDIQKVPYTYKGFVVFPYLVKNF